MKKIMAILLMVMTAITIQAKDWKTLIVTTTPQMHCSSCENRIKGNLKFEKGVKSIETNLEEQKVTVKYDEKKTNKEKILKAFEKIGFSARPVSSDEKIEKHDEGGCSNM